MKSDTFLRDFAEGLRETLPRREKARQSWLLQFLEEQIPTDSGRYSLEGHEPLRGIIELLARIVINRESESRVDILKAEQLGVTTLALGFALWMVAEYGYNVGYFLPDDELASEYGMARLNPIVTESPYLSSLMEDASVDRGVLKQIGEKLLYLIGLGTVKKAASRPMDFQISDEVDLTSEAVRRWKGGRMRHSKLRAEFDFSAPYRQDSGIDARYQAGSQCRWLVKCVECGKNEICLEESFPECMREFNGKWVRVCPDCKKKLDISGNGRWVATYPEREGDRRYSFRLSALAIEAIDGNAIMAAYHDALDDPEKMAIFDRTVRAMANAGALQPITAVELRRMERDYALTTDQPTNPSFFGIDCGNACWFWLEEWLPEGRPRLVWAEKLHSDKWVDRTLCLIARFQPRFGVIDKKPLLTDSRRLAYLNPRHVALQDFDNGKELDLVEERIVVEDTIGAGRRESGPTYLCVKIDRNLALAQFCAEATHPDKGLLIPSEQSKTMQLVHAHLKKLQKVVDKDAKGNKIHRFIDGVENHFGMAAASARIARLIAPNVQPFTVTRLGGTTRREQLNALIGDERRSSRRERLGALV